MVTFIKASFSLFTNKKQLFKVTPKSVGSDIKVKERRELRGQLAVLGAKLGQLSSEDKIRLYVFLFVTTPRAIFDALKSSPAKKDKA
jgi:hypothetical protein